MKTRTQLRDQICDLLKGFENQYDIDGLTEEVGTEYGNDIDLVPGPEFWGIVLRYDSSHSEPEIEQPQYGYRSWSPEERGEYDAMYDR